MKVGSLGNLLYHAQNALGPHLSSVLDAICLHCNNPWVSLKLEPGFLHTLMVFDDFTHNLLPRCVFLLKTAVMPEFYIFITNLISVRTLCLIITFLILLS